MKRVTARVTVGLAVFIIINESTARADDIDMLFAQTPTGKLVTGFADQDTFDFVVGQRSFTGAFTQVALTDDPRALFFIDDPGFTSRDQAQLDADNPPAGSYLALPGDSPVNFSIPAITVGGNTANLFFWDGSGAVNFQPTTDVTLSLTVGPDSATADGTSNLIPGFDLETTSNDGVIHRHPDYVLDKTTSTDYPAEGVYLLPVVAQMARKADSDFFTIAFATPNISADIEQTAATYIAAHVVPEPSAWMLAVVGVVALSGVGRLTRRERSSR